MTKFLLISEDSGKEEIVTKVFPSDEIIVNVKGWQKLVLDSIDDIIDEKFTLDMLLNQKRILSYQTRGEDLKEKVLENLNQLIDLGLVLKANKIIYVKLWS